MEPEAGAAAGRHVVVAFPLGPDAVAVLADRLGRAFAVRDIRGEGPPADLVLAPPCSPQAIGHLKRQFPGAAVVIVEIEDLLRGVEVGGPVSRALAAGADAYYVAPSTEALGSFLSALPLEGRSAVEALERQDQPVALPSAEVADALISRIVRQERATSRSDPATDP
jgi:hypothetical protein